MPMPNPIIYYDVRESSNPTPPFNPQGVRHYELSVHIRKINATEERLEFFIKNDGFEPTVMTDEDIEAFAQNFAMTGKPLERKFLAAAVVKPLAILPGPSRLDLTVDRQCYLLIHLDETFNWVFQPDFLPLSFKKDYDIPGAVGGFAKLKNFNLRRVDEKGTVLKPGDVQQYKCRTIFMSVNQRDYLDDESFNLHVEFIEGAYTLKTIFDPDIKNDGGAPFP